MNIAIAAVGMDAGFPIGGSGIQEILAIAAFVAAGLVLLFAAGRLCRRHGHEPHAARYAAPVN